MLKKDIKSLPKYVQPFLWSSNLEKIDLQKNKVRIILNVLNLGSYLATQWIFNFYSRSIIKKIVINHGAKGELSPKSLNYWTLVLGIDSNKLVRTRF